MAWWSVAKSRHADRALSLAQYEPKVREAVLKLRQADASVLCFERHPLFIYPWGSREYRGPSLANLAPVTSAVELLDKAIKIDPQRSDAYWHRARCKVLLGKIEEAESDLEDVVRLDSEHIAARILHESICHDQGENTTLASVKELAFESGGWKKHWLQAQLAYQARSYSKASSKFQDALKDINGKEPYIGWTLETRHARSMSLIKDGELIDAIEELAILINEWEESLEHRVKRQAVLYALGDEYRVKALAEFEKLFHDAPNPDMLATTACVEHSRAVRSGQTDADDELIHKWASRIKDPAVRQWVYWYYYSDCGNLSDAQSAMEKAAAKRPNDADLHFRFGEFFWDFGAEGAATVSIPMSLPYFRRAVALEPNEIKYQATLSYALALIGNESEARKHLDLAEKLRPHSDEEFLFLGLAFGALDQIESAQGIYDLAAQRSLYPYHEINRAGMLYGAAKRSYGKEQIRLMEQVIAIVRKLVADNPNPVLHSYSYMLLAQYELGRFDDVIQTYDEVLQNDTRIQARTHYWGGNGYLRQENLNMAFRAYKTAVRQTPDYVDAHNGLLRIMRTYPKAEVGRQAHELIELMENESQIKDQSTTSSIRIKETLATACHFVGEDEKSKELAKRLVRTIEGDIQLKGKHTELLATLRTSLEPDIISYASIDAKLDSPIKILPEGHEWRFRKGRSEPSSEWNEVYFDDSDWTEGPGRFASHRLTPNCTELELGHLRDYTTFYVRTSRDYAELKGFPQLIIRGLVDDGILVYVNGVEIGRHNVAGEPNSAQPFDATAESRGFSSVKFPIESKILQRGKNTIAIQLLAEDSTLSSNGMLMAMELVASNPNPTQRAELIAPFLKFADENEYDTSVQNVRFYAASRLLQLDGQPQAEERFEELIHRDPSRPEPWLRLAECQRDGAPELAAKTAFDGFQNFPHDGRLAELWAVISFVDLKTAPSDLLAELASMITTERPDDRSALSSISWLLRCLRDEIPMRINCGATSDMKIDGVPWSLDRFYHDASIVRARTAEAQSEIYSVSRAFRNHDRDHGYRIPAPNGPYKVSLYYMEDPTAKPGKVEFGIRLEGRLVSRPDFHATETGQKTTFDVRVEDGVLEIELVKRTHWPDLCGIQVEPQ